MKIRKILAAALSLAVLTAAFVYCVIFFGNQPVKYIKITAEEAEKMMGEGVLILDVRTQEEFDENHIRDAVLIPDFEIEEKAESVLQDKNQIILVYCRTGRRSEIAANILIELGYKKVYDFGGIVDWTGETFNTNDTQMTN